VRTLWAAALATFDMEAFGEYSLIGGTLLMIYLLMSNVMLLNLIIALLTNVYNNLIVRVDSGHHAVVIDYFNRWQWHDGYGLLIFLPSPFTYLVNIFIPLLIFKKETTKINLMCCKIFHVIYAIPMFLYFFIGSFMYSILCYFRGFAISGYKEPDKIN